MKKLLFYVILAGCFLANIANAGVSIDGNNDELSYDHWLPKKAYIAFNQQNGTISSYRVAFQADGGELFNRWKLKNSDDYEIPFPFVLEATLIIDDKNEVERTSDWGFGRLDGGSANTPSAYLDSTSGNIIDGDDKYGIGILDPSQLQGDVIYDHWVGLEPGSITPKDCRTLAVKLRFRLNIDLSEAKKFGYSKDTIEDDFVLGDGWETGYNIVNTSQNYSAQGIGSYFSFAIEKQKGSDYLTYSDYFNLPGMEGQWCKERNGDAYQVNSIEECFGLDDNDDGNGTDENPQIFTIDNHTHVIAPGYRCSKELGKSILCWESGLDPNEADGRRNCWNAWKWYQFNGEVSQVADHHNDSGWITNLSRDFTCNQVYNSGTNTSTGGDLGGTSYGTGNGTGNGYHNDSGDPWSGYVHHVGLQYLKIGKKSSGHWKGSKVWALSQIPTKRDFRVKLKRKGDKWTDVCAEIWFSNNVSNFTF